MKIYLTYIPIIIFLHVVLISCNAPSLPQPVHECDPPANALGESSNLVLSEPSTFFAWSSDGKTIIYTFFKGGLFTINLDAPENEISSPSLRQITSQPVHEYFDISVSDDLIAFSAKDPKTNQSEIYSIDIDGNQEQQLTYSPFGDIRPAWSPNGRQLVFLRNDGELTTVRGYLLDTLTLSETLLIDLPVTDLTWSPDGDQITFISNQDPTNQDRSDDLFIIQANGTGLVKLADAEGCDSIDSPTWSPNNQTIAFVRWYDFSSDLYLIDENSGNEENLSNSSSNEYQPAWSPTGSQIAYVSFDGVNQDIYVMDIINGNNFSLTNTFDEMESLRSAF